MDGGVHDEWHGITGSHSLYFPLALELAVGL